MKCFGFHCANKEKPTPTKSVSGRSYNTSSTDREVNKSESLYNSRTASEISLDSVGRSEFHSFSQCANNLRVFTYSELKTATKNFSRSMMIGEGGFGQVFKGSIKTLETPHTRLNIAVKQLNSKGLQGHKEWVREVNVLGIVDHPNLVKLVGYCADDAERGIQRLLVYELMSNLSVDDHLSPRSAQTLPWPLRLKIALDAARGLSYLHEEMKFQIIFRDLKTSNILLDENWNAKLSDFGLAREGPAEGLTHVSTAVVGTMGYAAPEYIQTGRLTAKSDIWSYGVVLYELITGRRPLDLNRPKGEQKLLEWVKPYISNAKTLRSIVDPRLGANYSLRSAHRLSIVANRCLSRHPKSRPNMSDVAFMVATILDSVEPGKPQRSLDETKIDPEKNNKKRGFPGGVTRIWKRA
ncbi:serine/threonine-protein kinase PCRK1-like [Wolffia australiana]